MRTPLVLALVLSATLLVPAPAESAVAAEAADPEGANALANIATFAMAYPARFGDGPTMVAARDELASLLGDMGYEVMRDPYSGGVNVLGVLRGTERPHDWVVLSAHYDIAVAPSAGTGAATFGAWDDGSGVAALLEIARVAAMRPWNNTLVIAFFDDEEGGLIGSRAFVNEFDGKAWEGGSIRLSANVNMDPPGLNWPCVAESGAVLPVTVFQAGGLHDAPGQKRIRELTFAARVAEGVPDEAWEVYSGGMPLGYVLSGTSDNARFASRGVPEMYIGSSTHLRLADAVTIQTTYPLHTPADTLPSMLAYCGGNPLTLAKALEVEMMMAWRVLLGIDQHGGAFPRP